MLGPTWDQLGRILLQLGTNLTQLSTWLASALLGLDQPKARHGGRDAILDQPNARHGGRDALLNHLGLKLDQFLVNLGVISREFGPTWYQFDIKMVPNWHHVVSICTNWVQVGYQVGTDLVPIGTKFVPIGINLVPN